MGVIQTGAIFKGLIFDGINSKNYGVYISGDAVFNAPERDVEMIAIPGRNGTFALDNGRFHNITVTYHAGLFGDTETDFAEAISDFRNMLCARKGYCRLTDDYNPDEYRMAVYKSGLEVDVASLEAGQFDIVFECKPQRFLKSGETAVTVTSGGTITNPTLFDAKPVLTVDGYGKIGINGDEIEVSIEPYGDIVLAYSQRFGSNYTINIDTDKCNAADIVTMRGSQLTDGMHFNAYGTSNDAAKPITDITVTTTPAGASIGNKRITTLSDGRTSFSVDIYPQTVTFAAGSSADISQQATLDITYDDNGTPTTESIVLKWEMLYDGDGEITITKQVTNTSTVLSLQYCYLWTGMISVYSTKTAAGEIYIDLDIGEAYDIDNGSIISVNDSVSLPAGLPTLKPGANTITYDNTVTQLKIVPRWWEV